MPDQSGSYNLWKEVINSVPPCSLTLSTYFAHQILNNPKHLLFTLARYKFVARLLGEGNKKEVLELGCNEALGTLLLAEASHRITAVDFDEKAISWAKENLSSPNITFIFDNFLGKHYGNFDAIVSLDVVEHIPRADESAFLELLHHDLREDGFIVLGTPNKTAEAYASEASRKGHVNLFDAPRLTAFLNRIMKNVFLFGINDEVVHTGFYPMCHYLVALGCNKRSAPIKA